MGSVDGSRDGLVLIDGRHEGKQVGDEDTSQGTTLLADFDLEALPLESLEFLLLEVLEDFDA